MSGAKHIGDGKTWGGPVEVDCPTGKTGWFERRNAKAALAAMPRGHGMSAYRCERCDLFHVGHLAPVVKRGVTGR